MHTHHNKIVAQIIFVIVIVSGIFIFDRFYGTESSVLKDVSKNEATLFIDFDNMQRIFKGEVSGEMTVLDALNASVIAGKMKLYYVVDGNNNTTVTEINDHVAEEGREFRFYINNKIINTKDLNKTSVSPGDEITIRLE